MNLKSTISILLTMGTIAAVAQPTLTASTSTPVAGSSETQYQNSIYAAGAEGAGQTWDFSGQTFPYTYNYEFLDCNEQSYCDPSLGTTAVGHIAAQYYYFKGTSTALSLNGITSGTGPGSTTLVNNQDILRFPFTYNSSFINNYTCTLNGVTNYIRTGIDSVSADAWGTLKTPAGTFTNVLRVKRVTFYRDSSYANGISYMGNTWETEYKWYDTDHKDFLYSTVTRRYISPQGNETIKGFSTYTSGQQTGMADISVNNLNLAIFPNPAQDYVQVSVTLKERSTVNLSIADITGRTVYNGTHNNLTAGDNKLNINTSGLPSGVYIVRIKADNSFAANKLVIQ